MGKIHIGLEHLVDLDPNFDGGAWGGGKYKGVLAIFPRKLDVNS